MIRPQADLQKFHRSLQRLNYTRRRMEELFAEGTISKTDLDSVYEALFLRAVTSFESFLEELFLAILQGKARYAARRVQSRMEAKTREALMEILLQGNQYMNWLPFSNTEKRAKLYLKEGRPFTDLTNGDRSIIKTITTIRNAIAHKSDYAMNKFEDEVIGSLPLLRDERRPAGFLRSQITSGPAQSRFEAYMGQLGRFAAIMC